MKKRILVVTPKFPYPETGACEQDRAAGLEMLLGMGYDVSVVTKIYNESYRSDVFRASERLGIPITAVTYKRLFASPGISNRFRQLVHPSYLDGSAYEYADPEMQRAVADAAEGFRPDLVWFDYTYLWPLYHIPRRRGIPIVTRSLNIEPVHFLQEDGWTPAHALQSVAKWGSEARAARWSDVVAAITPRDAETYARLGARHVHTVPLRGLARFFNTPHAAKDRAPLQAFFLGSTYRVSHNRKALGFILKEILPRVRKRYGGEFTFHIFGGKIPSDLLRLCQGDAVYRGYVPDGEMEETLAGMDIALVPSLSGAGMQQKVFEPLARGFPTITSLRALAGYPFRPGEHVPVAQTADEFADRLGMLRDFETRRALSDAARARARELFSSERIEEAIKESIGMCGI